MRRLRLIRNLAIRPSWHEDREFIKMEELAVWLL